MSHNATAVHMTSKNIVKVALHVPSGKPKPDVFTFEMTCDPKMTFRAGQEIQLHPSLTGKIPYGKTGVTKNSDGTWSIILATTVRELHAIMYILKHSRDISNIKLKRA